MNIIAKLNSISVDDIKNIDWEEVKEKLLSRPDIVIIIVCVALSIGSVIFGFSIYQQRSSKYKKQLATLKEKQKAIKQNTKTKKSYKKTTKSFPDKISKDLLGRQLSEFATNNDVLIESFSPGGSKNLGFAIIQNFSLAISVPDDKYDNLILFIKDIENSPYAIRIEGWYGSMQESSGSRRKRIQQTGKKKIIKSKISLQSITLLK